MRNSTIWHTWLNVIVSDWSSTHRNNPSSGEGVLLWAYHIRWSEWEDTPGSVENIKLIIKHWQRKTRIYQYFFWGPFSPKSTKRTYHRTIQLLSTGTLWGGEDYCHCKRSGQKVEGNTSPPGGRHRVSGYCTIDKRLTFRSDGRNIKVLSPQWQEGDLERNKQSKDKAAATLDDKLVEKLWGTCPSPRSSGTPNSQTARDTNRYTNDVPITTTLECKANLLCLKCFYLTCVSAPNRMTMIKKHMAHNWGRGIMATARG